MLTNYIKITLRNILRNKLHSFINIIGLSIGMACTILIMLWVQDELSYDKFHVNVDNLYRINQEYNFQDQNTRLAVTPNPLAASLKSGFSEIIDSTRWRNIKLGTVSYKDKLFREHEGAAADPSFLRMFTFPFAAGDPGNALSDPDSIIISRQMADKYFGKDEAVGKILKIDNKYDLKVSAVFENVPKNSHLRFDYIIREKNESQNWGNSAIYTYIHIREKVDYKRLGLKINEYIKKQFPVSPQMNLFLQPVAEIYLNSSIEQDVVIHGSIYYVHLFIVISAFILSISCINYICLTTARYSIRAKEVGIRKVSGANRTQIIMQFLFESIILTLIALIISIYLIEVFLPFYKNYTGKEIFLGQHNIFSFVLILLVTGFFTGIISGLCPAFILAISNPVHILKGIFKTGMKGAFVRKGMVLIQWVITGILITSTWIIIDQLEYIKNKDLGFDYKHVVHLTMDQDLQQKYEYVKSEMLNDHNVVNVTSCWRLPINFDSLAGGMNWEGRGDDDPFWINLNIVDYKFIETFHMKIIQGRTFSKDYSDNSNPSFILNETAIKQMGLDDPIGKWFSNQGIKGPIIGIVKDFNFKTLDKQIEPMLFTMTPGDWKNVLLVEVKTENITETIERLTKKINTISPGHAYEFRFLQDDFNELYKSEKMMIHIFQHFTVLGILIASLGLFAFIGFISEKRTKEIGIRKSLGASAVSLIFMMSGYYIKLVVIATILAWPIAWFFLNDWLNNYSYHIKIEWQPFIGTGLLVLIISQITIAYHCIITAMTDPVKALRYE